MNASTNFFESAIQRIYSSTSTRTQAQLADILGIRQSSISDAKKRGAIPADWQITLFNRFALNPAWICTGEGPQFLVGSEGEAPVCGAGEKPQKTQRPRHPVLWKRTHAQAINSWCPKFSCQCHGAICMGWLSAEPENTELPAGVCGVLLDECYPLFSYAATHEGV